MVDLAINLRDLQGSEVIYSERRDINQVYNWLFVEEKTKDWCLLEDNVLALDSERVQNLFYVHYRRLWNIAHRSMLRVRPQFSLLEWRRRRNLLYDRLQDENDLGANHPERFIFHAVSWQRQDNNAPIDIELFFRLPNNVVDYHLLENGYTDGRPGDYRIECKNCQFVNNMWHCRVSAYQASHATHLAIGRHINHQHQLRFEIRIIKYPERYRPNP
jgi:hypothetical protein